MRPIPLNSEFYEKSKYVSHFCPLASAAFARIPVPASHSSLFSHCGSTLFAFPRGPHKALYNSLSSHTNCTTFSTQHHFPTFSHSHSLSGLRLQQPLVPFLIVPMCPLIPRQSTMNLKIIYLPTHPYLIIHSSDSVPLYHNLFRVPLPL